MDGDGVNVMEQRWEFAIEEVITLLAFCIIYYIITLAVWLLDLFAIYDEVSLSSSFSLMKNGIRSASPITTSNF